MKICVCIDELLSAGGRCPSQIEAGMKQLAVLYNCCRPSRSRPTSGKEAKGDAPAAPREALPALDKGDEHDRPPQASDDGRRATRGAPRCGNGGGIPTRGCLADGRLPIQGCLANNGSTKMELRPWTVAEKGGKVGEDRVNTHEHIEPNT